LTDLVAGLRDIVGERWVRTGGDTDDYTHDATFLESPLTAVVLPATAEEVAAVVKLCAGTGTPITTRGAGSGLVGGPVPMARGVVLSTERFTQLEIDDRNLMAVAGAGVITGDLDAAAAERGLYYPPDPASKDICSIGGNVACNSGGLHCLKYGLTADYVVGMTVVLADGTILRLGGKLRKRSSGYRLMSLFVGSEGTLGIITEVVLKLIPRPRHHATAMVGYATIEDAAEGVRRVLRSGHFPAALELMNQSALQLVGDHLPAGFRPEHEAVLIVEQDGNDAERVLFDLAEIVEIMGGVDNRVAQSEAEREGIWRARRQFGHILKALRKNVFSEDVAVPISAVPEMVHRFQLLAEQSHVEMPTVGHAGDGNLHPTFVYPRGDREAEQRVLAAFDDVVRLALSLGGTVSGEHGVGLLKKPGLHRELSPEVVALHRAIKTALDPHGILNPGKVFDG
jgi:glycolate oxidase